MSNRIQRTSLLHRLSSAALNRVSTFFINVAVVFDPNPELGRFDTERDVHHFHRTPDVISLDQMYRELHFDLWEKELT